MANIINKKTLELRQSVHTSYYLDNHDWEIIAATLKPDNAIERLEKEGCKSYITHQKYKNRIRAILILNDVPFEEEDNKFICGDQKIYILAHDHLKD
jgi:hypothetical protein